MNNRFRIFYINVLIQVKYYFLEDFKNLNYFALIFFSNQFIKVFFFFFKKKKKN